MAAAGAGGAETKYVENNFSTQAYRGTGAARSITSGVDLSTDGGLVLTKNRTGTNTWYWGSPGPSTLGVGKYINSTSIANAQTDTQGYTAFNDDGYNIGTSAGVNGNGDDMVGYSFRKTPGILDVVQFVGNGVGGRNIPHNLGSKPGWIVIMCTTKSENKSSWHRSLYNANWLVMDSANGASNGNNAFPQHPTSTQFTIGTYNNLSGETYVAWIFGGGEEQGNASVQFNGIDDYLTIPQSSDYDLGTGEFTWECWVKHEGTVSSQNAALFDTRNSSTWVDGYYALISSAGKFRFVLSLNSSNDTAFDSTTTLLANTWYHLAASRDSTNTVRIFVNGTLEATNSNSSNFGCGSGMNIGFRKHTGSSLTYFKSKFSNFRLTKGQCLYINSFTPITTPLTTTSQSATASNVKLLCCNDTGASGYTKTGMSNKGGGLTLVENLKGSTASPFASGTSTDAGAIFGANEDKSLIKCGSYVGNGSSSGQHISIGWEPQWVLIKNVSAGGNGWMIYDTMRGWFNNNQDRYMMLNSTNAGTTFDSGHPTSTGFEITTNNPAFNDTGNVYMYVAIRRSDPEVGRPPEVGTDAFNVVYGNSSSIIPNFPSNFPVDMGIYKQPATAYSWYLHTRLTGNYNIKTDSSDEQRPSSPGDTDATFDSPTGWGKFGYNTDKASWMWKRHAGFDVVAYKGNGTSGHSISHGLSKVPEIIWVKNRTSGSNTGDWMVGFKDLYGGSSPWNGYLVLNKSQAQYNDNHPFNNYTPTAIDFQVNNWDRVNANGSDYTAMLFASVDGISKCGSYAPSSSSTTVTCGFQPRFVIVKAITKDNTWSVADSLRGMTAANDPALALNENWENDKYGGADWIDVSATGFTVNSTGGVGTADANSNGETYIYYAHA